jgi:hypothetical protein
MPEIIPRLGAWWLLVDVGGHVTFSFSIPVATQPTGAHRKPNAFEESD